MNDFIDTLKATLNKYGEITEIVLNALSLIFIVLGVVVSFIKSVQERIRSLGFHPFHTYFRSLFGGWLVVALELQLGADIVGTIISPSSAHLIELGAIAVIRTFLNYFLNVELKEERETMQSKIEVNKV